MGEGGYVSSIFYFILLYVNDLDKVILLDHMNFSTKSITMGIGIWYMVLELNTKDILKTSVDISSNQVMALLMSFQMHFACMQML